MLKVARTWSLKQLDAKPSAIAEGFFLARNCSPNYKWGLCLGASHQPYDLQRKCLISLCEVSGKRRDFWRLHEFERSRDLNAECDVCGSWRRPASERR